MASAVPLPASLSSFPLSFFPFATRKIKHKPPSLIGLHTSGFQLFESGNNEAGTSDDAVKTAPVNAVTARLSLWPAGLEEGRGTAGRAGGR